MPPLLRAPAGPTKGQLLKALGHLRTEALEGKCMADAAAELRRFAFCQFPARRGLPWTATPGMLAQAQHRHPKLRAWRGA